MQALRSSWKTLLLPEAREQLEVSALITDVDAESLRNGHVPDSMDDKWFVFFEDRWLYLHRSWTGACIYWLRLDGSPAGVRIVEASVNRDMEQNGPSDPKWDVEFLLYLLNGLLLGKPVTLPEPPSSGVQ